MSSVCTNTFFLTYNKRSFEVGVNEVDDYHADGRTKRYGSVPKLQCFGTLLESYYVIVLMLRELEPAAPALAPHSAIA